MKVRSTQALLLFIIIWISAFVHGYNMFHFPYFENDEGVYMSQAWSLVTQGKMAPYTYWYDHAPVGWIMIALWTVFTGGFYTFGFSLNSGRVLMLLLQVCCTVFVFLISKRLTKSTGAAILSSIVFIFSPLGIFFHRRILLDNLMTFWVLLSYIILLVPKIQLKHIMISAICFGIGVLSKENAIFFIPGYLLSIFLLSHHYHRHFAIAKWIVIVGSVVSMYFLFALLKGELFPYGSPFGGNHPHVSLLETLKFQASRGGGSIMDTENSAFWKLMRMWVKQDPWIMIGGAIANVLVFFIGLIRKSRRLYIALALCGFFFWYFLGRGGIVIEFYIVPLLPFQAMYIGIALFEILSVIKYVVGRIGYQFLMTAGSVALLSGYFFFSQTSRAFPQNNGGHEIYRSKQTDAQLQATEWVRKNVNPKSLIVLDNSMYLDLQDPKNPSGKLFPKAHWYWKVDQDPEIKEKVFSGSAESIDYVAMTPQMSGDLHLNSSPTTSRAVEHARMIANFQSDGWGVNILVPSLPRQILGRTWESYKRKFITEDGRTIDPYQKNVTTSEGQGYSMLRAVWMDDQKTFDLVWQWTKKNLVNTSGVFAWKYGVEGADAPAILDQGSASDADEDIALALLFASKRWRMSAYEQDAKQIIEAIWRTEVREMGGTYYLTGGDWGRDRQDIVVNPSYLAPYAYRIFADVSSHEWKKLADDSYTILEQCSMSSYGLSGARFLPPEWCSFHPNGTITLPDDESLHDSNFGYNAVRVPLRLAIDYHWYAEPKALSYLQKLDTLSESFTKTGTITSIYSHAGKPKAGTETLVGYSAALSAFSITNTNLATEVYEKKIFPKFYEDDEQSYWEDPGNYYTNNIAWFATAIYAQKLKNYWLTEH